MIKSIVYQSKTGHTQKYAQMFSAKSGLPCYTLDQAPQILAKGEEIIFMSWLMAGGVKGYAAAAKVYKIKAVCGVGMQPLDDKIIGEIKERHHLQNIPVFYLRGGLDINQLHGLDKFAINMVLKSLYKSATKPDATAESIDSANAIKEGRFNFVSEENLGSLLAWYNDNK